MFKIKQASLLSGFSIETLRFYDKRGIVEPSIRGENGYRYYTDDDVMRLQFIKRAKFVGFSLETIRELLNLSINKSEQSCEDVKSITAAKLSEIQQKIQELEKMQQALKRLHDNCCGGPESAEHCTILQALESSMELSV